jgi:hypothetical protein
MPWVLNPTQPSRSERLATALGGNAIWCQGYLPSDWIGMDWTYPEAMDWMEILRQTSNLPSPCSGAPQRTVSTLATLLID